MSLERTYQKIKPAIVAFVPKFHPVYNPNELPPAFPPIFGTGFIVADGLVVTNDHVVKEIRRLPKPPDCPADIWPVNCLLLYLIPNRGVAPINIDVLGVIGIEKAEMGQNYYGPPKPDIAFVHIKMKDLPHVRVKYNPKKIKEGCEVATAGFPMGTDTLMAPGYLHQITPTLQKGIISAILPFECDTPHALMINVMTQGGASGSPVFMPDSEDVIGVLYGGLNDVQRTIIFKPQDKRQIDPISHSHFYNVPTNASYIVPAYYITNILDNILKNENYKFPDDTPSLKTIIETGKFEERKAGKDIEYSLWGKENTERKIKLISPTEDKENPSK